MIVRTLKSNKTSKSKMFRDLNPGEVAMYYGMCILKTKNGGLIYLHGDEKDMLEPRPPRYDFHVDKVYEIKTIILQEKEV